MKKRFRKITVFLLLGMIISLECLWGYTAIDSHAAADNQTSYYLYPFEEAVETLEQLTQTEEIQAVVYLDDEVHMKALPQEESDTVRVLSSGDVVQIIGVGQDADYQIWYKTTLELETETVTGYVKRSNLACVQRKFTEWESNYVRSASVFRRMVRTVSYPDIDQFPESYQEALYQLKEQHPNWIFVKMNTGISWKTLVNSQLGERSLIYASTSPDNWKNGMYGTNWAYASEGILKYYLDPRNFLSENGIFQFELLGYLDEYHTVEAVEHILTGTFMYNTTIENQKTYAQNFVELGQSTQVSPFLMASRIRQEQGAQGNSALISGTYAGFEGYYNFYNIGASGKTDKEVIESGLTKAKAEGWDSRYKALAAGANFLGSSYIKHGQDTLYLQKFDVDSRYDGLFWHQYMQNIEAPYKEGLSVKLAYEKAGLMDSAYLFRIPVYEGMPSSASVLPGQEDRITLSSTEINNLQVDAQVTLHPFINGEEAEGVKWEYISSDTSVATVDAQGVVTALKPGETTITCRKAEDMDNTTEGSCKITVIKADVDISQLEIPQLDEVTYDPARTLGDISLPEGYSWVNPEMVPVVKQAAYGVEYNLDDTRYNSIMMDIPLTVNKAVPKVTVPTNLQGGATRELASVQLPQGYYWMEPSFRLPDTVGTVTCPAGYNPDMDNYESVENISLTIKVVCERHDFGEWKVTEATCEADGIKVRTCTVCAEKEEITLSATGHSYEAKVTKEATQQKEGERRYTCVNCRHSYTESIPKLPAKHEHSYQEEVVRKASCTVEGLIKYTCSCGDSYEKAVSAAGHRMKDGICSICGYKDSNHAGDTGTAGSSTPGSGNASGNHTSQNPSSSSNGNSSTAGGGGAAQNGTGSGAAGGSGATNSQTPSESDTSQSGGTAANSASSERAAAERENGSENTTPGGSTGAESAAGNSADENLTANSSINKNTANAEEQIIADAVKQARQENNNPSWEKEERVIITLNSNTRISKKVVDMAVNHGVDLELELPNALRWIIDAKSLSKALNTEIDMNAVFLEGILDSKLVEAAAKGRDYLELRLAHEGEFGFLASLVIPVDEAYTGKTANLFYYNADADMLEFQMAVSVEEQSELIFTFTHASDYLIVFADGSMEEENILTSSETETETEAEMNTGIEVVKTEKNSLKTLVFVTVLIMLLAVFLVLSGIWINSRKKEKEKKLDEEDYFDEDVDDYRERS